jgi:hypothetical protein
MIPQQGLVTGKNSDATSQNQPSDTETNDAAISETAVAAAGASMAAEPPGAVTEGSMGEDVDDNTLRGSAVDIAAQAPTGQNGAATYKQWSLESKLHALDVLKRFNGCWSKAVNHRGDTQSSMHQHLLVPHLQYCKRLESEDKLTGVEKRGGNQSGVVSTVCLKRMEEAARSGIAARGRCQGRP